MKLNNQYRMIIKRLYLPECTVGRLSFGEFKCYTLELPWLNNKQDVSCFSSGVYLCRKIHSPTHGWCIEVCNVYGRTLIRIHSGNFTSDILGCILVGDSIKDINNDGISDVTNSKKTLRRLMAILPDEFELEIGL